ncbi:glutamine synthetase family protein [Hoeflea prorocentri]|uniref:Glutamine synthetase family protein n=1 Tax=Hoeflea prorocentri TaxID=1922333 RepID=A0A9X3UMI3_9HYPH|nr:glutamine synthetase family protein [Hoeflea prorocentri]MCY6381801.1 glutamine synthetase family protein [Hoeflea prorocentri]MDA5399601.1 glutamine synthetase family protein [Hoeflea prorocentri]
MTGKVLSFVATSDLAGKLRGKGVIGRSARSEALSVGWVPTNSLITCFDTIGEGPYGSFGDLVLAGDSEAVCPMPGGADMPETELILGDITHLDGTPFECCPRSMLKAAIQRLREVSGLDVIAAFEHEFLVEGLNRSPGDSFTHDGFRALAPFGTDLGSAMEAAGISPELLIREFGPDQAEVTMGPKPALRAADEAVLFRALVQTLAERHGLRASFTPLSSPGAVGNGVHIHLSLRQSDGTPATRDVDGPGGLSAPAGAMVAGLLRHLPEIQALLAPSVISYARLVPHRWSAAFNNMSICDREAAVRICPVKPEDPNADSKFNWEVRSVDAAASPYIAMAALMHAMAQGVEDDLPTPLPTKEDLSELDSAGLAELGVERLPQSLGAALGRFSSSDSAVKWFGEAFVKVYAAHKSSEMAHVDGMPAEDVFTLYRESY